MSTGPVNALPGWWGKLPGTGDFSHRRLPEAPRARLDGWLQAELAGLRARHEGWQRAYLGAPLWRFVLGPQLLTDEPWLGVLMPSVDRVGRYFPLVILQTVHAVLDDARHSMPGWWRLAADAALQALELDQDPEALEQGLAARFGSPPTQPRSPDAVSVPTAGTSCWHTEAAPGAPLVCEGWPRGAHFDLLFDLAGLPATGELGA